MKTKEIYMYALGALIVIGFFFILYIMFKKVLPSENKEIALLVIGALVVKFGDVVGYFFGSSKGSADKTQIMNQEKIVPVLQTSMQVGSKISINGIGYVWDGENLIKQENSEK